MADADNTTEVFIHPHAIVESSDIGAGTKVWSFAHILEGAKIGSDCNICDHTFIESEVVIGNKVTIKCGCYLWDGVIIDNEVFLGPNVTFTNDIRPRSRIYPKDFVKTHVKDGASIGANSTIICGLTIGKWSMTGAGSVVTKDVPDYALVYGCPAKVHNYLCQCSKNLDFKDNLAKCECGKKYKKENGIVTLIQ